MPIRKKADVIQQVMRAIESGNFIPSNHAQEQMDKRNVQMSDVEEMIYRAKREEVKDSLTNDKKDWKYALRGLNNSGEKDIRIIVVFNDPEVVVVTVIDKNKKDN